MRVHAQTHMYSTFICQNNAASNLPRLKRMGQRNITVVGLNPPDKRTGIMHARNTNSSVSGACSRMSHTKLNFKMSTDKSKRQGSFNRARKKKSSSTMGDGDSNL